MKKGLDKEMIISLALIAMIFSVGIVFVVLFMFDIQVSNSNLAVIVGWYLGLTSVIWLILLCRNC